MRKIILITGKENCGKTRLSKQLANVFLEHEQIYIQGSTIKHSNFEFSCIKENTKSLIIDDLPIDKLEYAIFSTFEKITINKRGKIPFDKHIEQIIINITSSIQLSKYMQYDSSLFRRCTIINLDNYVH